MHIYAYTYIYAQVDEATIITDRQPTLSTPYTRLKTQLTGLPIRIDSHMHSYLKTLTESHHRRLVYPTQPGCTRHTSRHTVVRHMSAVRHSILIDP